MPREITEIVVREEDGLETHESWLRLTANRVSSSPGRTLFDSEIPHQSYVQVTINRCDRRRDLNRDWIHSTTRLAEIDMSMAQWGAFVSAFGDGGGVSATLAWWDGKPVPQAPFESRLGESAREVRDAGEKALKRVQEANAKVQEAFERGAGKKEMRELLRELEFAVANAPSNMKFAADSLTEHTEKVVTKAKADIEAMMAAAIEGAALETPSIPLLESGQPED